MILVLIVKEKSRNVNVNHPVRIAVQVIGTDRDDQSEVKKRRKDVRVHDRRDVKVISIQVGDLVQDHVQDPDINRRVVNEQDHDQNPDTDDQDLEIRIEDDHAQGVDQVRVVENRIIDVDRDPLVAGGVRGHTDIESCWRFRLYFYL